MAWSHELDDDRTRIIYQLFNCDNFEVLEEVDGFLQIFDKMPKRMKLTVDFRLQGYTNTEIAAMMRVKPQTVRKQLDRVKKRIANIVI